MIDQNQSIISQLRQRIRERDKELADIKLELSTPETAGLEKEPLYKWAALIVCEVHALRSQMKNLKIEIERRKQTIENQGNRCEERHNVLCGVKEVIDEYFEGI